MKALKFSVLFAGLFVLLVGISACDSDPLEDEAPVALNVVTVADLAADPFIDFVNGRPVGSGEFTYFCLRDNQVKTDPATTEWDIGLRGTEIIVNGGTSGPGNGAAQIVEGLFEEVLTAPTEGWRVDSADGPAIPAGSGEGWYNYNHMIQVATPIPGRVLLVRTADGRYAKMRIVSYYKGAPDSPDNTHEARYYTFEYVFQPDGSLDLN